MGKGKIAHYEQFSCSHSVFKRFLLQIGKNQGMFGKRVDHEAEIGSIAESFDALPFPKDNF